jgi:uncharacterized SAM-binding protein YcdF (DUF218 family)
VIRRWSRRLVAALMAAWLIGLVWFVRGVAEPVADAESATDAVVVLTGGSQRIDSGLALLAAGKARKLFVSGVHPGVDTAEVMRQAPNAPRWLECCIVLGHDAADTQGNAQETAHWLAREGLHSIRLVTANYHMRRALLEFGRVVPAGTVIIPHPVFPEGTRPGDVWSLRGTARLILIEYVKYLGALARPLLPLDPAGAAPILPGPAVQGPT